MHEIRKVSSNLEVTFSDDDPYVVVTEFDEKTLKDFISSCQKVIRTGIDFLTIVIDSYGGHCYTLLGMIDFLQNCGVKVVTVCEGKAMSAGAILFSVGEERYIGKQSTIMVHEVSGWVLGNHSELKNSCKEIERLNNKIFQILDTNTSQKSGYWSDQLLKNKNENLFLDSEQAKKHKIATHIGIPSIKTKVKVFYKLET